MEDRRVERLLVVASLSVGYHERAKQRVNNGGRGTKSPVVVLSTSVASSLLCCRSQQSRLLLEWPLVRTERTEKRTEQRTRNDGATSPTACNDDPESYHFLSCSSLC